MFLNTSNGIFYYLEKKLNFEPLLLMLIYLFYLVIILLFTTIYTKKCYRNTLYNKRCYNYNNHVNNITNTKNSNNRLQFPQKKYAKTWKYRTKKKDHFILIYGQKKSRSKC